MRATRVLIMMVLVAALMPVGMAAGLATTQDVVKSPNNPTSGDLVESPGKWDGKTIQFSGEVITEALERGDHAWIHVNDDAYYLKNVEEGARLGGYNSGHAVWLPTRLIEQVRYYGDYKHEGDVVTVTGTFNAACPEHGGDMDIHASALRVERRGRPVREEIHPTKVVLAIILSALAAVLWLANRAAASRELRGLFGTG